MRTPRIKIPPETGPAYYHLISRTVNGERLFGDREKEQLRRELWRVAEYCGVDLATYALMTNHFHVLVHVGQRRTVTDAELIRRYCHLHPDPPKAGFSRRATLEQMLALNDDTAQAWRDRQQALMGDISPFMQILKQRFAVWFNFTHGRFGPLWNARFTSLLVQGTSKALRTVAAYIDNNALHAGLVADPKDYRFSGYAEAVAGNAKARVGISLIYPGSNWDEVQAAYRLDLYVAAARPKERAASASAEQVKLVIASGGRLSLAEVVRCRWRFLTQGVILGTESFVAQQLDVYRNLTGRGHRLRPRPVPDIEDWRGLMAMRWADQ